MVCWELSRINFVFFGLEVGESKPWEPTLSYQSSCFLDSPGPVVQAHSSEAALLGVRSLKSSSDIGTTWPLNLTVGLWQTIRLEMCCKTLKSPEVLLSLYKWPSFAFLGLQMPQWEWLNNHRIRKLCRFHGVCSTSVASAPEKSDLSHPGSMQDIHKCGVGFFPLWERVFKKSFFFPCFISSFGWMVLTLG